MLRGGREENAHVCRFLGAWRASEGVQHPRVTNTFHCSFLPPPPSISFRAKVDEEYVELFYLFLFLQKKERKKMQQGGGGDFWEGIWDKVALYGELTREDGQITFNVDRDKVKNCPGASKVLSSRMFQEDTSSAEKKGWDWSGDTYISVYSFTATSLEEVSNYYYILID